MSHRFMFNNCYGYRFCRVSSHFILMMSACISLLLLSACQMIKVDSNTVSDYEHQLEYPEKTDSFVFLNRHVYENPSLGASLRYRYKYFSDDFLNIHIYPINFTSWKQKEAVLQTEYEKIMQEVDYAIEAGYYFAAVDLDGKPYAFEVPVDEETVEGIKGSLKLIGKRGLSFYSYTYVFIKEDKFIKFRLNLRANDRNYFLDPDDFVAEILPTLQVPKESPWMRKIRHTANQNGQKSFDIPNSKPINPSKVASTISN